MLGFRSKKRDGSFIFLLGVGKGNRIRTNYKFRLVLVDNLSVGLLRTDCESCSSGRCQMLTAGGVALVALLSVKLRPFVAHFIE